MGTPLDDARYVSLLSFKRDGTGVPTPVWAAPLDGKLVMYTRSDSYKVKRIRRNPRVRVARCDVRGKLLGPWLEGTCAILEGPEARGRVWRALNDKYGWQIKLLNLFAILGRRTEGRTYLEVTLTGGEASAGAS